MKGVILAGGLGSRLHPLTKVTNKHLLPVGSEPMLYHPIQQLVGAGVHDILVITSTQHMGDVVGCLGSGKEFSCNLSYKVQEEAGGIAHALALAEDFSNEGKICVLLGDNIFEYSIKPHIDSFREQGAGCHLYTIDAPDEQSAVEDCQGMQLPKRKYQSRNSKLLLYNR